MFSFPQSILGWGYRGDYVQPKKGGKRNVRTRPPRNATDPLQEEAGEVPAMRQGDPRPRDRAEHLPYLRLEDVRGSLPRQGRRKGGLKALGGVP